MSHEHCPGHELIVERGQASHGHAMSLLQPQDWPHWQTLVQTFVQQLVRLQDTPKSGPIGSNLHRSQHGRQFAFCKKCNK